MNRSFFVRLTVAAAAALIAVAPAAAKPKPPQHGEPLAVSASGHGIAPGAPASVRAHVEQVLEGKGQGLDAGIDFVDAAASVRSVQSRARTQWIGCRTVWAYRGYDHWFGYNLFRYYQQISWCSNGFSIYSWSRDRWPEVNGPGWHFDGHIASSLGGSTSRKEAYTQGAFHACVTWFCGQKVPWVFQAVSLDGSSSYNTGG